jgi:hypothetical protein
MLEVVGPLPLLNTADEIAPIRVKTLLMERNVVLDTSEEEADTSRIQASSTRVSRQASHSFP